MSEGKWQELRIEVRFENPTFQSIDPMALAVALAPFFATSFEIGSVYLRDSTATQEEK